MDRSVLLSGTVYALFGLATIFTIGRALLRWSTRSAGAGYAWDDWTGFLSYACVVGLVVTDYYKLENGLGRDIDTLDSQTVQKFLLWVYISQHLYIAVIFGSKLSLALLYLRAWYGKSGFRTACKILAIALVFAFVAFEVVTTVQCLPISYNWRQFSGATATCIDRTAYAYSLASIDVALNIAVLLLPLPKLLKLNTSLPRKIGTCAVLLVGLVVIAISAVRFKYLARTTTETNVTWYYSYIGLYSSIEAYLSQVCCCMPAMATISRTNLQDSTRLSGSSRKSESTSSRSQDRGSGTVRGIKGMGPSDDDPEKARADDESEEYERAPSPVVGLQSRRAWEETISSISQFPIQNVPASANRFRQPSLDEQPRLQTPSSATSSEGPQGSDAGDDERPLEASATTMRVGIPSIVHHYDRSSPGPRPQSVRLSTDLVPFSREVKLSASRLNLHSW